MPPKTPTSVIIPRRAAVAPPRLPAKAPTRPTGTKVPIPTKKKDKIGQHRDNTAPDKCNEVTGARQRCPVPSLDWHQSSLRTLGDNTQGDDQSLRKSHDSDEEPEVSAIIGESAVQQFSETQWAE